MGKFANPVRFSDHFNIKESKLERLGVLNPTLNVDTKLFIDPVLLKQSAHKEFNKNVIKTYEYHFGKVIKLLLATKKTDDPAWKAARRLLTFPEIKWTCLGYGAQSISGSGSGDDGTNVFIVSAKEIIDLGVHDPDLFVAMSLFEKKVGPDKISDMTTNVILRDLLAFNSRVLTKLGVPLRRQELVLKNGSSFDAHLPVNPCIAKPTPIVLVPTDLLRALPVATDWDEVGDIAARNEVYRRSANEQLGDIWKRKSLEAKEELKDWATAKKGNFEVLLELIRGAKPKSYDIGNDPLGELVWRRLAQELVGRINKDIELPKRLDLAGVKKIVSTIVDEFKFLIEGRRLSEELYGDGKHPRPERAAQRLFFAVAYAFCKAHNLDLTLEADTGNGPVDFKVSTGFRGRVLVEIKLSTNNRVIAGYTRQLEAYKSAEETAEGFYVLIDVGQMGLKAEQLLGLKNDAAGKGEKVSELVFVDGILRPSASKL